MAGDQRSTDIIHLVALSSVHAATVLFAYARRNEFPVSQRSRALRIGLGLATLSPLTSLVVRLSLPDGQELVWLTFYLEAMEFFLAVTIMAASFVLAAAKVMVQKECVAYAENSAAARSEEDAIALAKQAERVKRLQLLSSERFATYALIAQVPVGSIIYVVWGAVDSSVAFSRRGQYNWTILHVLPALIFFAIVTPFMLPFIKYMKKEPDMHSMAVEVAAHNAIGPPVLLGVLIGLTVNPLNVHVPIVAWVTQIGISIMLVIPALMSCGFDPTRGRWCLHWHSRRVAAAYEWAGEDEVVALQRIVDDDTGCYLFQRLLQERSAITALLFVQAVDAVEGDADHCAAVRRRISDTFLVDGAVLHVQLVAGNNAAVAASIEKGSGEEALASARKDMWERLAEQHVAAFLASPYFAMWVQSAGYLSRYVYGRKDSLEGVDSISEMELVELPVI